MNMNYTLHRMTPADAPLTVDWLTRQYGFDRAEVDDWVANLHFNWPLSVKAVVPPPPAETPPLKGGERCSPETGELSEGLRGGNENVVGLLNMSDYRIEEETPLIAREKPDLLAALNAQRYTAVFSFIVAPEYRGTRLNYDMLMSIMPELRAHYDFIFVPVLHRLKTHRYWQRWGATEFYRDADCVYYRLPLR